MLFIVAFHYSIPGFNDTTLIFLNNNNFFLYFLNVLGGIGDNVFIILSAYFMINSKFTFKKFLMISGEVYFYSIIFLILFSTILTPVNPIDLHGLIRSIFPITHSSYWFITDYIILMILSPFLNKFIKSLSATNFLKLIGISLLFWSLFPMISGLSDIYNGIIWFIILYFIGSFIRLHFNIDNISFKNITFGLIISTIILYVPYAICKSLNILTNLKLFDYMSMSLRSMNSILILIIAIFLFLIFLKRNNFSNKYINFISGSVLGVYLIHANFLFHFYLWENVFKNTFYYSSSYLILHCLFSVLTVYAFCTLIDIVRRLTIEKIWIYIIDTKLDRIPIYFNNKLYTYYNKFKEYQT